MGGVLALTLVLAGPVPAAAVGPWRILPAAPLGAPYTFAGAWTGRELLVAGRAATPDGTGYNVAAAYHPDTGTWRRLAGPPPFTGNYPGRVQAMWTGREVLLWGAGLRAAYDPANDRWRRLPAPPPGLAGAGASGTGADGQVVAWTGRRLIVWGGCCGHGAAGGAAYDPSTDSWRRLPPAPLAGRYAAGAWTGRELVLAGGYDPAGTVLSGAAAYDPDTRTWRRLADLPAARAFAAAVWDGTEVLLVGGQGPTATHGPTPPYRAGLAFDPDTDSWRWLPAAGTGRVGSAAVWAGRRLLVWGGRTVRDGTEVAQTRGLSYDPDRDTWSTLADSPLAGRTDPVAVWTGASLIVWGGRSVPLGSFRPDGAAYTPGPAATAFG